MSRSRGALRALQAPPALTVAYLLGLLGAAARDRSAPPPAPTRAPRLAVIVPAHDEEAGIAATLRSLAAMRYPPELLMTIVVADNCNDATAAVAREEGAVVLERTDPARRGKGHALAWALERLETDAPETEAVLMVDADCEVDPGLAAAATARLAAGAGAVQCDYVVANPEAAPASALRYAAFALVNTVRPAGKESLGLSAGLTGTGMAFSRELLRTHPWDAFSLAEDAEYHLRLVEAGERVSFVREAAVRSPMPTSHAASESQQARWEGGRMQLARRWTPRLLAAGLRERDRTKVHAALEQLVPPQAALSAAIAAGGALSVVLRDRRGAALAAATAAGQAAFVLGGLRLAGAPAGVYRSLAAAPAVVARKLVLLARISSGGGPGEWVRTEREQPNTTPAQVHSSSVGNA